MKSLLRVLFLCFSFSLTAKEQLKKEPFDREKVDFQIKLREFKRRSYKLEKQHPFVWSDDTLDILIPVIEKDLDILPFTITYARKNILHPVKNVYIVAPNSEKTRTCVESLGCRFIDEATVFSFNREDIDYFPGNSDRRGWLFQQMLKLQADHICECENILILDADTLLMRPQTFFYENKVIMNCSEEKYFPYRVMYEKLTCEAAKGDFSFVAHNMLFQKKKLESLKRHIEDLHGKIWYEAIFDLIDKNEFSGFSEYETYGQFISSHYQEEVIQLYFFNLSLNREKHLRNVVKGNHPLGKAIKTCSFHSWLNK